MNPARPLLVSAATLIALLAAAPLVAQTGASVCALMYERADNPLAAHGRPDGMLGKETVTIPVGGGVPFQSAWRYEKQRSSGQTRYGSHLRRATNTGQRKLELSVFQFALFPAQGTQTLMHWQDVGLNPGESKLFLHDLVRVSCPQPGRTDACVLEYERTANDLDLPDKQDAFLGAEQVILQPGSRKAFVTDRKYVRQRGTEQNRYGSNLRRALSRSDRDVRLLVRLGPSTKWVTISTKSWMSHWFVGDLVEVHCPV